MHDLADAMILLENSKSSPKDVRRSFSNFVELSQKLTSCMRKEYSGKWEAEKYEGWNGYTEIIKKLRNYDQHEQIIRTEKLETTYHTIPAENGWPEITLGISGTLKDVDQLSDKTPSGSLKIMAADPKTGKITNKEIGVIKEKNYKFMLNISENSDKGRQINKLLKKVGNPEIFQLASECFSVLKKYYEFYQCESKKI